MNYGPRNRSQMFEVRTSLHHMDLVRRQARGQDNLLSRMRTARRALHCVQKRPEDADIHECSGFNDTIGNQRSKRMKRRIAKVDSNQAQIVDALRAIGCTVLSLAPLGNGCPDLLVGIFGRNLLLEVKDGTKSPSRTKLTPLERSFHSTWKGQTATVLNVEDAIRAVNQVARMTRSFPLD